MKAILLSIKPQYCELIASGKKTIEVRKTKPKLQPPFKCLIYCTKPKYEHEDYISFNEGTEQARAFYGGGKIIGEFICDRIEEFESEFFDDDTVMNGIYRVVEDEDYLGERIITRIASNEEDSENFWICTLSCLSFDQIKKYIGYDKREKTFYGWHISDLKIYDTPKELSKFTKYNRHCEYDNLPFSRPSNCNQCVGCKIEKAPQSWCYVEE